MCFIFKEFLKGPGKPAVRSKEYNYQPKNTIEVSDTFLRKIYKCPFILNGPKFQCLLQLSTTIVLKVVIFENINNNVSQNCFMYMYNVDYKDIFDNLYCIKPGNHLKC